VDTQTVSAGDYLLKYNANPVSRSVDIDLTVGSGLTLATDTTGALRIIDTSGELKDRLDLPAMVNDDGSNVAAWDVTDAHHAAVTLSQAAIDEGRQARRSARSGWTACRTTASVVPSPVPSQGAPPRSRSDVSKEPSREELSG
jgi:hypothetical protein